MRRRMHILIAATMLAVGFFAGYAVGGWSRGGGCRDEHGVPGTTVVTRPRRPPLGGSHDGGRGLHVDRMPWFRRPLHGQAAAYSEPAPETDSEEEDTDAPGAWPAYAMDSEAPPHWMDAVQDAVERCKLSENVVDLDCSEYPCMAIFRVAARNDSAEARQAAEQEFLDRLRGCDALHGAFGWRPDDPEKTFAGLPFDLSPAEACPGELIAGVVAFPRGSRLANGTLTPAENAALEASIMRRIARAHASWECAGS